MDKAIQDVALGTVGWFAFAAGTVGLTAGQTLRLSVVNLSPLDAMVLCGIWQNPRPLSLAQDSYTLGPGEARNCDLKASDLSGEIFVKTGAPRFGPLCAAAPARFAALWRCLTAKQGERASFSLCRRWFIANNGPARWAGGSRNCPSRILRARLTRRCSGRTNSARR